MATRERKPALSAPPGPPGSDVALRDLLAELGYSGPNEAPARAELERAGLTRPGKQRIALHKRPDVERVLHEAFLLLCARASCRELAAGEPRQVLRAERPGDCAGCGGSGNRQAIDRMCQAMAARGLVRLAVVGGSPSVREELLRLVGDRLELRLIDGTERRTQGEARNDLRWAQLCVVWGGTELDHKVSGLYTGGEGTVLTVHRRGIAALCEGVREHLERGRATGGSPS